MTARNIIFLRAKDYVVRCSWNERQKNFIRASADNSCQLVDVQFSKDHDSLGREPAGKDEVVLCTPSEKVQTVTADGLGRDVLDFLLECLRAAHTSGTHIIRLIIPLGPGTVLRSDIVPLRLRDAFWTERSVSFARPLQTFSGHVPDTSSLPSLLLASAGAVLFRRSCQEGSQISSLPIPDNVESDFRSMMELPWISPTPIMRRRLVLVGRSNQDPSGGGWTQFACRAALALGIDLVIVDQAGGWLEQSEYLDWYEALLPAGPWWSNPPRDDMAEQLVSLIESYDKKVDGIITFTEPFQVAVSLAAKRLGLAHQPPTAYETATNKHKLGIFEGRQSFCAYSAKEALEVIKREELAYPLILKPCYGLNSEGVARVDSAAEIPSAVNKVCNTFYQQFLIEKYCDGPEVDVNMVLIDNEVVFSEICDDFPKPGDTESSQASFHETNMVFPSALPADELKKLEDSVSKAILGLGFSTGVLHVEARVGGSSVEYRCRDGIVDLCEAPSKVNGTPEPWVLEVNPRPPGLIASQMQASTYGIDYWGISLLLALDDKERARALCQPFKGGAQLHGALVLISADYDQNTCEGIFDSDNVTEELWQRKPELASSIHRHGCLLKRGQRIPHPDSGKNTFVAYFNVFSRNSRKEALEIAAEVRKEVRYSFL
ncbi:hypothetical protein F5Y15DRAFT_410449 [Xylariaceae sp. FL0016]|nr:hypothetical protein F5Y15DRAFT_410449 [Xylariaceae sp. FL0016]